MNAKLFAPARFVWLVFWLAICVYVTFGTRSEQVRPSLAENVKTVSSQQQKHVAIEDIRLGWRVLGDNPLGAVSDDAEPDPATWRLVRLESAISSGVVLESELLRPLSWIIENHVVVGEDIDLPLSEHELSGRAKVIEIGPCPPIASADGNE